MNLFCFFTNEVILFVDSIYTWGKDYFFVFFVSLKIYFFSLYCIAARYKAGTEGT